MRETVARSAKVEKVHEVRQRAQQAAQGEEGEALLFAVFVLLLLGLSLALLTLTMRLRLEEQQREVRRAHLDCLLDGAIAETLARLAVDPRFPGLAPRRDGRGEGEGWSEVELLEPEQARVEAGARLGGHRVLGRALVRLVPGPPRVVRWERARPEGGAAR